MTKRTPTKLASSILNQLRKLARERGDDFQLVLLRHVNERLLYRLAQSAYVDAFVLKGAALFTLWTGQPHRATRDIDLLGFGEANEAHLREVFTAVLSLEGRGHGVLGHGTRSRTGRCRIRRRHHAAGARRQLPTLLDLPAPHLRVYPRETVVAEKLEAMVQLGSDNSRMKDFCDIACLARDFGFDGELLARALRATSSAAEHRSHSRRPSRSPKVSRNTP